MLEKVRSFFEKTRSFIKKYCPLPALILILSAAVSALLLLISEMSPEFSNFFNRYIGSFVRGLYASITTFLPFSLAETLILSIPVLLVAAIVSGCVAVNKGLLYGWRRIFSMLAVLAWFYTSFVFTTGVAYNCSPLSERLGLEEKAVSTEELSATAEYLAEKVNSDLDEIIFMYNSASTMPFSLSEMSDKLLEAYDSISDKYPFVPRLYSRIKQVSLSEPWSYTHITGMYTYYTGEANLNVNFPDYTLPFTAAHELAHQRGILPENEANFMAFLVCIESDDPYIRYSGYFTMYEYVVNALAEADMNEYVKSIRSLDYRVLGEIYSYNDFFEKYADNTAANVAGAMNDGYLKSQGVTEGEKSYGMVVDLAVAYAKLQPEYRK